MNREITEGVADALASFTSRLEEFRAEKETQADFDTRADTYITFIGEAQELLNRLAARGLVVVPKVPSEGLLNSMAMRYDHGLFMPAGMSDFSPYATEADRQKKINSVKITMKQLHEEVVGTGFFRYEAPAFHTALTEAKDGNNVG